MTAAAAGADPVRSTKTNWTPTPAASAAAVSAATRARSAARAAAGSGINPGHTVADVGLVNAKPNALGSPRSFDGTAVKLSGKVAQNHGPHKRGLFLF